MSPKPAQPTDTDFPSRLSNPARRALIGAGYTHLEQLAGVSETTLAQLHGMGPKGVEILRAALAERGLRFGEAAITTEKQETSGEAEYCRILLENLRSDDKNVQNEAFQRALTTTEVPVKWAYGVWDELVSDLEHPNNRRRAIAAQILCNLAKSDPQHRMNRDFARLLAVTKDERFVTARHCLQALWKVGLAGVDQRGLLIRGFERRFDECAAEKNCTLIRADILQGLKQLYQATQDESIKTTAAKLIAREPDLKYRKKYSTLWR